MNRKENESYLAFVKRVTNAVTDNIIDYTEWSESLLGQVRYSYENLRRCYQVVNVIVQGLENDIDEENQDKADELRELLSQIKAERIKLSTTNIEYNAIQRAEARNDLFNEELIRAIGRLEPLRIPVH